jgi:hypothetical protein
MSGLHEFQIAKWNFLYLTLTFWLVFQFHLYSKLYQIIYQDSFLVHGCEERTGGRNKLRSAISSEMGQIGRIVFAAGKIQDQVKLPSFSELLVEIGLSVILKEQNVDNLKI